MWSPHDTIAERFMHLTTCTFALRPSDAIVKLVKGACSVMVEKSEVLKWMEDSKSGQRALDGFHH